MSPDAPGTGRRRLSVVQLLPAMDSGGAERSALEVARALVAAGHRSTVISAGGRMVAQLRAEDSEHITLDIGRKSLITLGRIPALRRAIRSCKADIVHARSRLPAWLARAALRGLDSHFVTTVHGLNSPGRYSAVMLRGERVIAVSDVVRDYVRQHYPWFDDSRMVVIPRGIDTVAFPRGHRPEATWSASFRANFPALADNVPWLVLPGRGTRLKGHADAIRLHAALKARGVVTRLLLLGIIEPGREAYVAEMQHLAEELGVRDSVVFTPQRDDVRDVLASSALVLQLSTHPESFGRTVVEALSLGRPVLGYAHGGVGGLLAELYPAGCVPLRDAEALIERAMTLLADAPPVAPLQRYTLAQMQQSVLRVYRELVDA